MQCIIDSREQSLLHDLEDILDKQVELKSEMLTIGDLILRRDENDPLLLIERKTIRDLVSSIKDGRYHDQRRRWATFQQDFPNCRISLWLEGDLLSTSMDETLRGSLLNSLFRLQSIHNVIVYMIRSRESFVKSLQLVLNKFLKDPYHLVNDKSSSTNVTDMKQYKRISGDQNEFWMNCLAIIPGVSLSFAELIVKEFPSLTEFIDQVRNNKEETITKLANIQKKRKLGQKLATKIVDYIVKPVQNDDDKNIIS
jgi:ERCC4-type nuclease